MNYFTNSRAIGTFSVLCKRHLRLVPKYFCHPPKKDPTSTKQLLPIPSIPSAQKRLLSSVWIYLFWIFHIQSFRQLTAFGTWPLSLTVDEDSKGTSLPPQPP